MKIIKIPFGCIVVLVFALLSCEGKFEPVNSLGEVQLLLPINNQECLGVDLPNGKIRVSFDWEDVDGVATYELEYEDTVSQETFAASSPTSGLELELEPGTLYAWKVTVSDDFGNSKTSETFNFYTEGLAEENHVPFPAEIDLIDHGDGTATLSWTGTDLDDDIAYYDVYFSNQDPPSQLLSNTTEQSTTVSMQDGITYFINIRTVDENGNYSDSKQSMTP
ncbi:fibronectin type III domain-containing protein [Flagellimonas myxillae]|uniref:fibronectin type III domain-containing protein n=1 Tax=Flagellimonas myxillae TaxID=2942214 RepID=UPI00201EDC5E|nr:hypothetical protein [Muricauda myxillae]MCL6265073.1 hypothetical protein [Muricauda myxillae]